MTARDDRIELLVGGEAYSTWTSVKVDSDLLVPADAFEFALARSVADRSAWSRTLAGVRAGQECVVRVNGSDQMVGEIDEAVVLEDDQQGATLHVAGRDRAGAVLDWDPPVHLHVEGVSLLDFVRSLVEPFGISTVRASNVANRSLLTGATRQMAAEPVPAAFRALTTKKAGADGESSTWQLLERHVRRFGVLPWMAADGSLVLSRPDYDQAPSFRLTRRLDGAGNNLLTGSQYRVSSAELPTSVTVAYHTGGGDADRIRASETTTADFRYPDGSPALPSRVHHPRTIKDTEVKTREQAIARGRRELLDAWQGWRTYNANVQGFGQGDRLWAIDTLGRLRDEIADLDEDWYVHGRTFEQSREGTFTRLRLSPKGAIVP